MSYTYSISETLQNVNGSLLKMIAIEIDSSVATFYERALWPTIRVVNGSIVVHSFKTVIKGNYMALIGFFTIDAFLGFSSNSIIEFGYGTTYDSQITGVDVSSVNTLPSELQTFPHLIADNKWLQNL